MSTAIHTPSIENRGREVTKDEFYAHMNCDVHPRIVSNYDDTTGYLQAWTMQDMSRKVIGYSDGGTHLMDSRYWLAI